MRMYYWYDNYDLLFVISQKLELLKIDECIIVLYDSMESLGYLTRGNISYKKGYKTLNEWKRIRKRKRKRKK